MSINLAWRVCRLVLAVGLTAVATGRLTAQSEPAGSSPRATEQPNASPSRDLPAQVRERLQRRLPEAAEQIHVEARDGEIALTGTVGMLPLKQRAGEIAGSVRGVEAIANELRVAAPQRSDADLARDIEWALKADPATLGLGVDVAVDNGVVTLTGAVDTFPEKRIAAWVAGGLLGVREVKNEIRVTPERRDDRDIHLELLQHYARSPVFNDDEIDVQVEDGVVALSGHVDSALEKNWAREDAWIPGVTRVDAEQLGVTHRAPLAPTGATKQVTDEDIRQSIVKAFVYDPRIASANPEVVVDNRVVTLRGEVRTRSARQAAVQIARNTGGVVEVTDRLDVRATQPRTDPEIAQAVRTSIRSSAALAGDDVNVEVNDGRVVLTGNADSFFDIWVAGYLSDRTEGVAEVENRVTTNAGEGWLAPQFHFPHRAATSPWIYSRASRPSSKSDEQLVRDVRRELSTSPFIDAATVRVEARNGTVTLGGELDSWSERAAAVGEAYQAGAREVVNRVRVAAR